MAKFLMKVDEYRYEVYKSVIGGSRTKETELTMI